MPPLPQISSLAWEHPADRAALNTLRALPGFDQVVRQVAGAVGERGIRHLFLANAVRVGPTQRPKLWGLFGDACRALDWPGTPDAPLPQLYVTQTPFLNAGAVGFAEPFIVLNSATLEVLDPEEQKFILAHELGHIISGHVTYRTIAVLLLTIGLANLPFLAGVALLPFQLALLEWYRKAELSSDRAGLLGVQEPRIAYSTFLKMAGGTRPGAPNTDDPLDLDAFLAQAAEYDTAGTAWDTVLKAFNTALRDHPFNTVRVAELQKWVQAGDYARIVGGDYLRRGAEPHRPLGEDYAEAADYYGEQVRQATATMRDSFNRAAEAFAEAFRGGPGRGPGGGTGGGPRGGPDGGTSGGPGSSTI